MLRTFKRWWLYYTGDFADFTMENRAFNVVSALCSFVIFFMAMANFLMGFTLIGLWTFLIFFVNTYLFYLSRFRGKFGMASFGFSAFSYVLLAGNFIINSGISGPTVYGFFLTLILIIVIAPRKLQPLWIGIHLTIVPLLFLVEAVFPELMSYQYDNRQAQIIDHVIVYVPVIVFIYVIANFLRSSYHYEKKQAERATAALARKNKELEFSNREKDRLFSIIAHDLRGPLHSISSYLEMLNDIEISAEERTTINSQLLSLTQNTSTLLNNLLNWSARRAYEPSNLRPIGLQKPLEEVVELMQPEAQRKDIQLKIATEGNDLKLMGEPEMLYLVLRNLINNAIKFTREGGEITIAAKESDGKVTISIKDNGIGIPEEKQPEIFGTQIKPSAGTQSEKGIGLGLVLCHDFVRAMEGEINFTSRENIGSEFTVVLKKPA